MVVALPALAHCPPTARPAPDLTAAHAVTSPGPRVPPAAPTLGWLAPSRPRACSANAVKQPVQAAVECQSGSPTVELKRSDRRSNGGQAILRDRTDGPRTASDLVLCAELRGFEPQTSCMPSISWQVHSSRATPPRHWLPHPFGLRELIDGGRMVLHGFGPTMDDHAGRRRAEMPFRDGP